MYAFLLSCCLGYQKKEVFMLSLLVPISYYKPTAICCHFPAKADMVSSKAYIPPERKIPGVGGWRWAMPPTPEFCMEIPTCWYILALPPTPITDASPNICVTPDANPRRQSVEYRWRWVPNTTLFRVGHVHFMLFMPFFSALGTQRECYSQWNMGLKV